MGELRVMPVTGIGEVRPGDDLAATIAAAAPWLADGDVVVVTSKIVSKSEGRLVELPPAGVAGTAGGRDARARDARARDAVITAETARPVARRGSTRIVQTRHGFVMASAGVDASNVDPSLLVLLPVDPDASARSLRAALRERYGVAVAVIVTDTMGRPWRTGLVDVAIGVAGLDPLLDHRGLRDGYGNELHVTVTAVADQLAAAAELVKGKRDGVPVAVVRGWPRLSPDDGPGARALVRAPELDMFRLGTAEALAEGRAEGLRAAASLDDAPTFGEPTTPGEPAPSAGPAHTLDAGPAHTLDAGPAHTLDAGPAHTLDAGPAHTLDAAVDRALDAAVDRVADRAPGGAAPALTRHPVTGEIRPLLPPNTVALVVVSAATRDVAGDVAGDAAAAAFAAGSAVHRVRAALAAAGLATIWLPAGSLATTLGEAVAPPRGLLPFGVLAIGAHDPAAVRPSP